MADQVRFIRRGGRVIPIHQKVAKAGNKVAGAAGTASLVTMATHMFSKNPGTKALAAKANKFALGAFVGGLALNWAGVATGLALKKKRK